MPGCWLWTGALDGKGYGAFTQAYRTIAAHRFSYSLYKGEIPASLQVQHTCDTPCCVNPAHLGLGTYQKNAIDMVARGRHGVAKLNADKVRAIRAALIAGETQRVIAQRFSVSCGTVGEIARGKRWAWVDAGQKTFITPEVLA